jgi:hypothetical protein
VEGHSREDPTRDKTRAVAALETLRAAASGPVSATVKGSYSCLPMMLGECGICRFAPDRVVPPLRGALAFGEPHGFAGSHTALPGAASAAIKLNPQRRHFVPPKVAQVPIPLRSS